MKRLPIALVALFPTAAWAGGLIPPMLGVAPNQPSYVVTTDGTRLEGKVIAVAGEAGDIKKLTVKAEDGTKTKLKAAQIAELGNKPGDLGRLGADLASTESISASQVYDARSMPEWMTWYPITLPKNGKVVLLQRINPGIDSRLQVYPDPFAQETAGMAVGNVPVSGGVEKSFIVVKDGAAPVVVKKNDYDEQFGALFGDCSAVTMPEKLDWKDFGAHVEAYDQACGKTE